MDAAKGAQKPLSFTSMAKCGSCEGSGLKSGTKLNTCPSCKGSGVHTFPRGGFMMQTSCQTCEGTGKTVPPNSECRTCSGQGRVRTKRDIVVNIPAGVEDGMNIRLARQGNAPAGGQGIEGDLYVSLNVESHPIFGRKGADVLADVEVPLNTALLGGNLRVPTIDGDVDLKIPSGIQPNEKKVLRGRGAARLSEPNSRGDMWVTFKVQIPKHLTEKQRQLIAEAFAGNSSSGNSNSSSNNSSNATSSSNNNSSTETSEGKGRQRGFFKNAFDRFKKGMNEEEVEGKESEKDKKP